MLTTDQVEVLARWRKFVPNNDVEDAPELTDDDAAAIACQTMITAYCKDPKHVDWSELSKALEQAQGAFGFERSYADQVVAALAAEAAERKETEKLFPLAAWQKDVANGNTQLGYDEWVKERREAVRPKARLGMRWGILVLAVGASLWLLSYAAWVPAGLVNILAGATQ